MSESSDVLDFLTNAGLKPGINWRRELEELINDIAMRDGLSCKQVAQCKEVQEVLKNPKLTSPRKLELVKDVLQKKRYPMYSKAKAAFDKELRELKLSPKLKVKHTPYFEDTRLSVGISDDDKGSEEVRTSLKKLEGAELVRNAFNPALAVEFDGRRRDFAFRQGKRDFFAQTYQVGTSSTKKGRVTKTKGKITSVARTSVASSGFYPRKIIVEKSVAEAPLTKEILAKHQNAHVEFADDIRTSKGDFRPDELIVAEQKSNFIKRCPGTPKYRCCDYYVLNIGIGCDINCTYCYLHHYMNTPNIAYVNIDKLIEEVKIFCASKPDKTIRLGSGEFVDSIGFEKIAPYNELLIPALSQIPNLLFEVKTKSAKIDDLLSLEHNSRVAVSFSLNSREVIEKEESEADLLDERLKAAKRCQDAGYKIGFHFDPLIYYKDWEQGYKEVIDMLFEYVEPKNIAWISLGALRFNKALKPIIQKKFPKSRIIYEEMVPGLDGKLRYFVAIRKKMFSTLNENIRSYSKDIPVYLCMEGKELAEEVGAIPALALINLKVFSFSDD
ncbi:hypothetical protein LCGC14_1521810 [marine sediment metagenome]|uniref:Radical SAM core domain-containing protein n=1 Tax=marine sediment metagenome TaxID=412755 RepID=A0A0F9JJC2_9ZZZZ